MAKTNDGKKKVHVPSHIRIVNGRLCYSFRLIIFD